MKSYRHIKKLYRLYGALWVIIVPAILIAHSGRNVIQQAPRVTVSNFKALIRFLVYAWNLSLGVPDPLNPRKRR